MAETGMVEKVARAIAGEIDCVDWTAPDNTMSHPARLNAIALDAARAAIEAMREPTPDMKVRHWTTLEYSGDVRETCHAVWREMIDAILKEGD